MSRVKLLLDLIQDVRAVADDLQTIADAIVSDEQEPVKQEKPEPEKEAVAPEQEPEKTIRLEDVRAVLAAKSREGYGENVRNLIAKFGAEKLSEVDPSHYGEMLKEAEVFGHAT